MQRQAYRFQIRGRAYSSGSFNVALGKCDWRRSGVACLLVPHPTQSECRLYINGQRRVFYNAAGILGNIQVQLAAFPRYPVLEQGWMRYAEIEDGFFFSERENQLEVLGVLEDGVLSFLYEGRLLRLGKLRNVSSVPTPSEIPDSEVETIREEILALPTDRKERRKLVRS